MSLTRVSRFHEFIYFPKEWRTIKKRDALLQAICRGDENGKLLDLASQSLWQTLDTEQIS